MHRLLATLFEISVAKQEAGMIAAGDYLLRLRRPGCEQPGPLETVIEELLDAAE
ncbi:MAG: hypothetical protein ACI92S_004759 [Planctomycetaceae bacterium]|jgi:hypothetical protein